MENPNHNTLLTQNDTFTHSHTVNESCTMSPYMHSNNDKTVSRHRKNVSQITWFVNGFAEVCRFEYVFFFINGQEQGQRHGHLVLLWFVFISVADVFTILSYPLSIYTISVCVHFLEWLTRSNRLIPNALRISDDCCLLCECVSCMEFICTGRAKETVKMSPVGCKNPVICVVTDHWNYDCMCVNCQCSFPAWKS